VFETPNLRFDIAVLFASFSRSKREYFRQHWQFFSVQTTSLTYHVRRHREKKEKKEKGLRVTWRSKTRFDRTWLVKTWREKFTVIWLVAKSTHINCSGLVTSAWLRAFPQFFPNLDILTRFVTDLQTFQILSRMDFTSEENRVKKNATRHACSWDTSSLGLFKSCGVFGWVTIKSFSQGFVSLLDLSTHVLRSRR